MVGVGAFTAIRAVLDDGREPTDAGALARTGSERTSNPAGPIEIGPGPDAYAVTYEVREPGRPPIREVVAVERPYASRRVTPADETVTDFARLAVNPEAGVRTVVSPPPAPVDPRPGLVVARAVEEGFLAPREQRRVAGRTCQVYRALEPVSSSTISAALPGRYTDTCIDGDGLVLEEWQVTDGEAVRQRLAVDVAERADVPAITAEPTLSARQGGGSVLAVDPASRPEGRFYELAAAPDGFRLRGRYAVVPPQAGLEDPDTRRRAVASTADVFERGPDVLIVDRGSTLNLDRAFQPRPEGRPIADLGPAFGGEAGELLLSWNGPEVRWGDEDGRFVRVYGTVDIDTILATMRSLRATEGGSGLVYTGARP